MKTIVIIESEGIIHIRRKDQGFMPTGICESPLGMGAYTIRRGRLDEVTCRDCLLIALAK